MYASALLTTLMGSIMELTSTTAEREEQRRRVEEARLKRQEEKKEEDQRFEEAARQRQQLQQSGPGQISGRSREPAQQQHSRRPDQRGSGTAGQHAT